MSCSDDGTLRVWDLAAGTLRLELRGHGGWVNRVRFTPDGDRAVSSSKDGTVRLWDLGTGEPLRVWRSSGTQTYALALTADGRRVVSVSGDGTIEFWDASSDTRAATAPGHTGPVTDLFVSDDGARLFSASGYGDATIRVWPLDGTTPDTVLRGHTAYVVRVVPLPGGRIVSASLDGTVRVWDMDSGTEVAAFTADSHVYCCAAHPSGVIVADEDSGHVHVLRLEPGRS